MNFWDDPRMLAEGNARGLPGGDPDHPANQHYAGGVVGSDNSDRTPRGTIPAPYVPDLRHLSGSLDAHADRLGIPVEQLVSARVSAGGGSRLIDLLVAVRERFSR